MKTHALRKMSYQTGQRPTKSTLILALDYKEEYEKGLDNRGVQRVKEVGLGKSLLNRETVLYKNILFVHAKIGLHLVSKT
ncbi:hypothetical protein HG530_004146 [Fusarium avenaceum]|nr:hypothetical protein HG530_004146 [Fusarium avenaceum]